jgi:hypothetical protein
MFKELKTLSYLDNMMYKELFPTYSKQELLHMFPLIGLHSRKGLLDRFQNRFSVQQVSHPACQQQISNNQLILHQQLPHIINHFQQTNNHPQLQLGTLPPILVHISPGRPQTQEHPVPDLEHLAPGHP